MERLERPNWDGVDGTAGGPSVGAALRGLALERGPGEIELAAALGATPGDLERIFAGDERLAPARLARFALAVRLKAVEFLQRAGLLSLETYASGLDPLYFLPPGQIRKDARIYMREINPRHRVPERDMLRRNPTLHALAGDEMLDETGKLELEIVYLLRIAVQQTGGSL
jgi:hypothetical protein